MIIPHRLSQQDEICCTFKCERDRLDMLVTLAGRVSLHGDWPPRLMGTIKSAATVIMGEKRWLLSLLSNYQQPNDKTIYDYKLIIELINKAVRDNAEN